MIRNVHKCLSAQGLWRLQESWQRERWNSETAQEVWSTFRQGGSVEPPQTLEWGTELRELVWKGVPGNMREEVYMSLSGEAIECLVSGGKRSVPLLVRQRKSRTTLFELVGQVAIIFSQVPARNGN